MSKWNQMKKRVMASVLCAVITLGSTVTAFAEGEESSVINQESSVVIEEIIEAVEESSAAIEESSAVIEESSAIVEESSEVIEEPSAIVEESSEVIEESSVVVEGETEKVETSQGTSIQENAQATAELVVKDAEKKIPDATDEVKEEIVGTIELTAEIEGITITLKGLTTSFEAGKEYKLSVAKIENEDAANNGNYEVIEDEEIIAAVEEAVDQIAEEKEKVVTNYQAYDIKLMVGDEEVQPIGPVEVKFSGKEVTESVECEETETSVIHVNPETNAVEDMEAEVTDEKDVAIETNHFSIYVFVELEEAEAVTLTVEHWVRIEEDGEYAQANNGTIELPNQFVGNLEDLIAICVSDDFENEDVILEKVYIEENGSFRNVNDKEILTITKDTKIKLEYFVDYEKAVQLNIFSKLGTVKVENTINKDKTADGLDENDQTNVTLSVGGDESDLGVDIIYIAGRAIAEEEIRTDVMINCLMDTFREIIAQGTQVNFGIVPFSSTSHAVLDLTPLRSEEDLEELPEKMVKAFEEASVVYDGVNMENALVKAKDMFENSELKDHPERQHLVMISSGHTYFFNSGENNEVVSTVPVRLKYAGKDSEAIFYMEKAWMRARNNSTNSYPIPMKITEAYNKEKPAGITLWEYYWNYIDVWAKADIAAGDIGRYDATTVEAGNFVSWMNSGMRHPDQSYFSYSGNGAIIKNPSQEALENTYFFDIGLGGTEYGPNPLVYAKAAHAIGNERAMWEAYNYLQDNITGEGISFYPVYQPLRPDGSCSNDGATQYYSWTGKQIGHSFMNMLAGGEAVTYSETDNKAFFDPIKRSILYSVSAGSSVEDYIGYDEYKGNFDFIQELVNTDINEIIKLKYGDIEYTTKKLVTPSQGATSTYTFTAPGADESTFTLDYYYGNGTTTERFVWTFGEHISKFTPVTLTYKLQLKDKIRSADVLETSTFEVDTNINATLYPINSDGNERNPEVFPIPKVEYTVYPDANVGNKINKDKTATPLTPDDKTDVTLRVGGGSQSLSSDIVFVVDKSQCEAYATAQLKEMFDKLIEAQKKSGATIKVAIVVFSYKDNVPVPLTVLTEENADTLLDSVKKDGSGTNIEAGLLTAKEILDADKDVPARNKHMILISDGLTWIYDNDERVSQTILYEYNNKAASGTTNYDLARKVSSYKIPAGYPTWNIYWKQIEKWVLADGDKYDFYIENYGSSKDFNATLGTQLAFDKALNYNESQEHAVNMERAMYDAWLAYTALEDAGYNCYANNLNKDPNSIGYNLMRMFADGEMVNFDTIQDSILHSVSKGTVVTDYIGYSDDELEGYDFNFVRDEKTLSLKVGSTEYVAKEITSEQGVTCTYEFTAPGASEATFLLEYYYGNGTTEEHFDWTFGEDVSNIAPVTLTYQLDLVKKSEIPGTYDADTNQYAIIYPVDSEGNPGNPEYFPVPEVEYVVPLYELPSTGANGFYQYTFSGVILMIGAALVIHKNKQKEEM